MKDKSKSFEQKSKNRFELATQFINTVNQAEIIALRENPEQSRDFLKKIGSNFQIREQKLILDFKNPWKILLKYNAEPSRGEAYLVRNSSQNPKNDNWRRGRDLNPREHYCSTCTPSRRTRPLCDLSGINLLTPYFSLKTIDPIVKIYKYIISISKFEFLILKQNNKI